MVNLIRRIQVGNAEENCFDRGFGAASLRVRDVPAGKEGNGDRGDKDCRDKDCGDKNCRERECGAGNAGIPGAGGGRNYSGPESRKCSKRKGRNGSRNGAGGGRGAVLPREDLRYLRVLHKDLEGNTKEGELICNAYIAEDLLDIFRALYENGYPIEKIRLVDEYDADDLRSMADNNSSSFNFRRISHSAHLSKHSYGLAVDINPLYNPYVKWVDGKRVLEPDNAEPYLDREGDYPYKITRDDLCCRLFFEHGFTWGGDWKNSKDYQHFELPSDVVRSLYPDY